MDAYAPAEMPRKYASQPTALRGRGTHRRASAIGKLTVGVESGSAARTNVANGRVEATRRFISESRRNSVTELAFCDVPPIPPPRGQQASTHRYRAQVPLLPQILLPKIGGPSTSDE